MMVYLSTCVISKCLQEVEMNVPCHKDTDNCTQYSMKRITCMCKKLIPGTFPNYCHKACLMVDNWLLTKVNKLVLSLEKIEAME